MLGILRCTFAPITQDSTTQIIVSFVLSFIWLIGDKLIYIRITRKESKNTTSKLISITNKYNWVLLILGAINIVIFYYIPYIQKALDKVWILHDWIALIFATFFHLMFYFIYIKKKTTNHYSVS